MALDDVVDALDGGWGKKLFAGFGADARRDFFNDDELAIVFEGVGHTLLGDSFDGVIWGHGSINSIGKG